MKIRTGFVSNSSSSSFILLIKGSDNQPCTHCGRKYINVIERIDNNYGPWNYDNEVKAKGIDNIIKRINEDWWTESEHIQDLLAKLVKLPVENNDKVYYIDISNHDDAMLDSIKNDPSIEILYESND